MVYGIHNAFTFSMLHRTQFVHNNRIPALMSDVHNVTIVNLFNAIYFDKKNFFTLTNFLIITNLFKGFTPHIFALFIYIILFLKKICETSMHAVCWFQQGNNKLESIFFSFFIKK